MVSKITSEIKVSVTAEYDHFNSYPSENRYVFKYHIEIQNLGSKTVKLLSRRWMIYDLGFGFTEVEGAGVIGLTPTLESGESFSYFSNVILKSGVRIGTARACLRPTCSAAARASTAGSGTTCFAPRAAPSATTPTG